MGEGTNLVARHAPSVLARAITNATPFTVDGDGAVQVTVHHAYHEEFGVLTWQVELTNTGERPAQVNVAPLRLELDLDPDLTLPRVRHLSGSYHFDACYPSRAFRVIEEAFMTHDHSKPVVIGGLRADEHVPILQFALEESRKGEDPETGGRLSGFFVGFEWSGGWELKAGWERFSWQGETRGSFLISGSMSLGELVMPPGESVTIPAVHLGFFERGSWEDLDNRQRRYIREGLAATLDGERPLPVSYDHWFGLYTHFDLEVLKRQADRAAELGCEYFCLDAAWYRTDESFIAGLGNWSTPDPGRFPRGEEEIAELSEHVRGLGMGFGLWHLIQAAAEGTDALREHPELFREHPLGSVRGKRVYYRLKLETAEGVAYAVRTLSRWIREWHITWMRYESVPGDGLAYNRGFDQVIDTLRAEFPDLYLEICNGGGQRLDLSSVARTHGNWLSDHTSNPEVCRFMQTGALRFWPANFLNVAVTAFRGRGAATATPHQLLSRMVGVMSFNGAIAEWTGEQAVMARRFVEVFKRTRSLKDQPVLFPLPQPRSVDDWDAVLFGDGNGPAELLFVFRVHGSRTARFRLPSTGEEWTLLLSSGPASLRQDGTDATVSLPPRSGALWIRER